MPSKTPARVRLGQLERELEQKLQALEAAAEAHRDLQLRHQVLAYFCDAMQLMRERARHNAAASGTGGGAPAVKQHGSWACAEEQALLQQLQLGAPAADAARPSPPPGGSPAHSCESSRATSAASEDDDFADKPDACQPCTTSDALWLVRTLLAQPPVPCAATITLQELQACYGATVHELALQLHLHDAGGMASNVIAGVPPPVVRMRDVLLRHMHLMSSVQQCGRRELVCRFTLTNCATGEQAAAVDGALHVWAAQQVQLTAEQRLWLAQCLRVTQQLLAPVRREATQLQAALAAADEAAAAAVGAASGTGEVQAQWRLAAAADRQQLLGRLGCLMEKERCIHEASFGAQASCMAWHQLARLCVLVYPSVLAIHALTPQAAEGGAGA